MTDEQQDEAMEVLDAWEVPNDTMTEVRVFIRTASFEAFLMKFDPRITTGVQPRDLIGKKVRRSAVHVEGDEGQSAPINPPIVIEQTIDHKAFQRLVRDRREGVAIDTEDAYLLIDSMISAAADVNNMMQGWFEEKIKTEEGSIEHEGFQGKTDACRLFWAHWANRWFVPLDYHLRAPQRFIDSRTGKEV